MRTSVVLSTIYLQELWPRQVIPQRVLFVGPRVVSLIRETSLINYLLPKTEIKFTQMHLKDHIKTITPNIFTIGNYLFDHGIMQILQRQKFPILKFL